ncbi:MAG TPA: pyridoxamine 5'-phosphate oxidase family protein [Candidatus Omnitrophota bacterium]|nr:pyridoxamine 5'-phosphate oxidase family protein [Candidatus Omnitrophota bacterium]HPT06927.1 pyridoxamine 5'-phosphate oxidase family protein [Candidatus Omnitrophota bacterium]
MRVIAAALKALKVREFVSVATVDLEGRPNCAPKLLLKIDGNTVYFVDYSIGRTSENLHIHPEVSLSFIDMDSLVGYRLNGTVEIIGKGKIFEECLEELHEKEIKLSVERVIKGVHDGKLYKDFELELSERFLVYKIVIVEASEISPRGAINRENI